MRLLYMLNQVARTSQYINCPINKLGFPGVTCSQNLLIRDCSSMITNPIYPNPSSPSSSLDPKVKEAKMEVMHKQAPHAKTKRSRAKVTGGSCVKQNPKDPTFVKVANIGVELFDENQHSVSGGSYMTRSPKDPTFVKVANIAVELFNKYQVSGAYVEFLRLMEVSRHIVCGCVFYITLEGFDHGARAKRVYKTEVSLEGLEDEWVLISFEPQNEGMEVGAADPSDESK